jgi:hypothetical protein
METSTTIPRIIIVASNSSSMELAARANLEKQDHPADKGIEKEDRKDCQEPSFSLDIQANKDGRSTGRPEECRPNPDQVEPSPREPSQFQDIND